MVFVRCERWCTGGPVKSVTMSTLDEEIARQLEVSRVNGELSQAPSWGRPLAQPEGWDETPEEFRLPFKVLKDAGVLPAEVEMMRQLQALRSELAALPAESAEARALRQRVSELQQSIALRLERLRASGSL